MMTNLLQSVSDEKNLHNFLVWYQINLIRQRLLSYGSLTKGKVNDGKMMIVQNKKVLQIVTCSHFKKTITKSKDKDNQQRSFTYTFMKSLYHILQDTQSLKSND